ncbi:MAG TPA: hypothetical protein VLM89_01545 [Phycisphaerae bacterium]|nr:hypothetical protein [Phycisphaerae bacterium]
MGVRFPGRGIACLPCLRQAGLLVRPKVAFAITINCLGLFAVKGLPAYPCFGFVRLNDAGFAGVCEADLPSTFTRIIYQHSASQSERMDYFPPLA